MNAISRRQLSEIEGRVSPVANWPIWAFLVATLALIAWMTGSFAARHGGVLYPLDDSYIHLALARTLSESGVWGLIPSRPSAASSSPLWTLLLTAAAKVMPWLSRDAFSWVPLIGNLAAALGLVIFWRRRLAAVPMPNLALVILIVIMPLPTIVMIGMEHVLHALLASMFAWHAAVALEQQERVTSRQLVELAVLSALAVGTRYETLALVVTVALLSVYYRRPSLVPAVLLPPAAVVAGFGWIWVRNGGWWVPNSFLLKTGMTEQGSIVANVWKHVIKDGLSLPGAMVGALLAAVLVAWLMVRGRAGPARVLLVLGGACTVAQFVFGQIGWLNRYEAWLVALDGLAILLAAGIVAKGHARIFAALAIALLVLCLPRAALSYARTAPAAKDREWEHFGPAEALAGLAGKPLLVNDIGVIAYYGAPKSIDMFGLADNESLRRKRAGQMDGAGARRFAVAEHARFGEFQVCWDQIRNRLPAGWTLVEAWTGRRNVVFGDLTLGFFAEPGRAADELREVLARAKAPAEVRRFDHTSPFVQAYNANPDKNRAAMNLCRSAAIEVTGAPDRTIIN